jgi:putative spermidine/putrescine transport system ATP-binding protein
MNQLKNHLDLIDLEKRYGETLAVRGINLSLPENTYCCLLGPSGCGKTSLLRMIAGHEDITSGTVFLDNQNISNEPPAARSTSMMFQSYALFPHLKVIDNVAFALKIMGVGKT